MNKCRRDEVFNLFHLKFDSNVIILKGAVSEVTKKFTTIKSMKSFVNPRYRFVYV